MIGSGCIVDVPLVYDRKSEMEYCSAGGIGFHPDSSIMRLDDGARNRQADAHAVTLGRDERLKQLPGAVGRDSSTAVGHADPDQAAVRSGDGDDEVARLRRFHRIHRIADQIEQDLLTCTRSAITRSISGLNWNCTRMPRSFTPTSAKALASSTSF